MTDLPRLKPDPIPAIHPVPEYAATDELAQVYAQTKAGLGVPWMGVVAMAFAHYPRFYATLWSALAPIAGTACFERATGDLRRFAEAEVTALDPPDRLPQLSAMGYGAREIDEIRACNEVFSAGNMPFLLMAALARVLLEGGEWTGEGAPGDRRAAAEVPAKPVLIEAHHADPTVAALYAEIRQTLGLPFVNTDYRAFARWPSYFVPAWQALKQVTGRTAYTEAVENVHGEAVRLARNLPNVTGLSPAELQVAAGQDASLAEVLSVVRLFQWLLPGLAVNVAFLRAQLMLDAGA